jgi:pyruvate-formate lyase-activating enzyme
VRWVLVTYVVVQQAINNTRKVRGLLSSVNKQQDKIQTLEEIRMETNNSRKWRIYTDLRFWGERGESEREDVESAAIVLSTNGHNKTCR